MLRLLTIAFLTGVLVTPVFAQVVPNTYRKEPISRSYLIDLIHTQIRRCWPWHTSTLTTMVMPRPNLLLTFNGRGDILDIVDTNNSPDGKRYIAAMRRCGPFLAVRQFTKDPNQKFQLPVSF